VSLRRSLLGACALIAALAVAAPAQARMINTTFRYDTDTNNCDTGEQVLYTQTLHIVAKTEIVDGEETVVWARFDPLEAQGTGVESGDHYQISTKSISIDHPFNAAQPLTLVGQFHVIDTGSGADFMIGEVFHVTVNANEETTVWHTSGGYRCGDVHDQLVVNL